LLHLRVLQFTMATADALSLHELQPEPNASTNDEHASRQQDLDKKRVLALVGSALSQLPIWGEYISNSSSIFLTSQASQ
jgi:hypothetical protein